MKNKLHYLVILGFLVALIGPGVLFSTAQHYIDTKNHENREFQQRPSLSLHGLPEFPGQYETYFNDHLPFKNQLVRLGQIIDFNLFQEVTSSTVVLGKDHWLFYKYNDDGGDCIADYRGINRFTPDELAQFSTALQDFKHGLDELGIEFHFLIVPNKEQVYSEFMPSTITVVNPESKAEQFVNYLKNNTDVSVFYPLEDLIRAKDWSQVYLKYDTHWNKIGSFITSLLLIDQINGQTATDYKNYPVENLGPYPGDLAKLLEMQNVFNDDSALMPEGYLEDVHLKRSFANENETLQRYTSDVSDNDKKILIYHDSFGLHIVDYFSKNYPEVTLADYRYEDLGELVEEIKPDVVIIEMAERYVGVHHRPDE